MKSIKKLQKDMYQAYAEYVLEILKHEKPDNPIVITYTKHEERMVKEVFSKVLGDYMIYVKFMVRPLSPEEKKLRQMRFYLSAFTMYLILITIGLIVSIVYQHPTIDRAFDLLLYIGNVVGLGMAFYILRNAIKLRKVSFLLMGLVVLFLNGLQVLLFLYQHGAIVL